jgi:hypothetical protein
LRQPAEVITVDEDDLIGFKFFEQCRSTSEGAKSAAAIMVHEAATTIHPTALTQSLVG